MYKNIEKQKVLHMAEQVDYQDGQIVSRTLVQNSKLSMTLFAFEMCIRDRVSSVLWLPRSMI